MAQYIDWLPTTREGQLAMARKWQSVVSAKADPWDIPQNMLQELGSQLQTAETTLAVAKHETTRTPVATAQCKEAFEVLTGHMQDMKRRYCLTPPLTDSDYISLGLKPHDGTPTAQITIEIYLVVRHELGVRIAYVTGNPASAANKGYRMVHRGRAG